MPYVEEKNRNQMMMCSLDDFVDEESVARLIDAFVESLDLSQLSITKSKAAKEGRPCYNPRGILKLFIYGHYEGIRSSRKLAKCCRLNVEAKWLMSGLEPDFRTLSDFRKANTSSMKKVFREFNKRLSGAVEWGFASIDGSKIAANNAKDNCFTKNKLDDRIKWLNEHTDEYLRQLEEMDELEELNELPVTLSREELSRKLEVSKERLSRYEAYQKLMEDSGMTQLSLVDADAKLMKSKNGFVVAYNPQTAVDSNTHLIRDFQMTNQVTDHGLINSTMKDIKEETPDEIIEATADKGYVDTKDMARCLENGIIPNVILEDGKDTFEIELPYEENNADIESTKPEELRKTLRAGKIPEAYKNCIDKIEVVEKRSMVRPESTERLVSKYGSEEEMIERAKSGYFVRDPERNLVYCPNGEILRQKCIKKSGEIRYANKLACRHCKNRDKCYKGKNEWKEVDFSKDKLEKPCKDWLKSENITFDVEEQKLKRVYQKIKVVKLIFRPDRNKMSQRMCLSEHPFGTIKRAMGMSYFLLKGIQKVAGEFALSCLGYNIKVAQNLLGFNRLMKLMVQG